ncbi:hypothetical protein WH221_22395 [Chryseobacterium culicis]|nr:hypothetical protein [Chryseobacterium culicis]
MIGGGINSLRAAVANNVARTANFFSNDAVRNKLVVGEDGGLTLLTGVPKESLKEKVANGALDWGTILLSVAGGPEGMLTAQGGRSPAVKGFEEVKDAVKTVHGNSKASMKAQHGYEIFNKKTGETLEFGISGQKRNASQIKNGGSPRINQKLKTKYNNNPNVEGRVIDGNLGKRKNALDWEQNKVNDYSQGNNGQGPRFQKRPQPK